MRMLVVSVLLAVASGVYANDATYVAMEQDLAAIKSDFNEAVDQVRLVFIVGPT